MNTSYTCPCHTYSRKAHSHRAVKSRKTSSENVLWKNASVHISVTWRDAAWSSQWWGQPSPYWAQGRQFHSLLSLSAGYDAAYTIFRETPHLLKTICEQTYCRETLLGLKYVFADQSYWRVELTVIQLGIENLTENNVDTKIERSLVKSMIDLLYMPSYSED